MKAHNKQEKEKVNCARRGDVNEIRKYSLTKMEKKTREKAIKTRRRICADKGVVGEGVVTGAKGSTAWR